ncbi:MAG: tetratricopeptide repeat protein [Chthoniobacterales bacterium]|nr:tetratricopeptide repeat protein [Chthoniobacterales bacterium]
MVPCFYLLVLALIGIASTGAQEDKTVATTNKKVLQESSLIALQASKDYDKGDFASAEKKYQQLLSLSPHDVETLNHLAAVEIHLNKTGETERLLKESLQQKLENPNAWLLLGLNDLQEQRIDEAFAALVQATLYDPKNAKAHHYLGIVAGRKEWHEISEASLRKAIELDPKYAEAHFNLAVYYMRHNPPAMEAARRHYQRALDLGAPHDPVMDTIMKKPIEDLK